MGAGKTWALQLVASAYRTKRAESARANPVGQVSNRCEPRRQCERQEQLRFDLRRINESIGFKFRPFSLLYRF
jgi:hypothetical protein